MNEDDDNMLHLFDMLAPKKGEHREHVRLTYSAHVGLNAELFPAILKLHVKDGARIADVTYGKGAFWKFVPNGRYTTVFSDLNTGKDSESAVVRKLDCRKLPYADGSFDAVVLDPPYMHVSGGTAYESMPRTESSSSAFEDCYRNNEVEAPEGTKWHEAVLALYYEAGREAARVLKKKGTLIVKCQDEVCAHRMRLTHMEIAQEYAKMGLECDDLFVVVATNNPGVSRMKKQYHSRRNHSFFVIFKKKTV
jgi:hypothetical protein